VAVEVEGVAAVVAAVEVPDDIGKTNVSYTSILTCKTPNFRIGLFPKKPDR